MEDDEGVTVHRLRQIRTVVPSLIRDASQRHAPPFPDPITVWGLRRLIRNLKPDVVHSQGWMTYSCAAALLGMRIPLVVTARDYGYFCANRTLVHDGVPCSGPALAKCCGCAGRYYGRPKGWIATLGVFLGRRLLRRKMTALHSVSNYVASVMREHFLVRDARAGVDRRKDVCEIVIPSFRADELDLTPSDVELTPFLEALPSGPFILFVGALRRVKGVETLLDAYARLDSPPPLVLIGTYEWDSPSWFPPDAVVLTDYPHEAVMAAWDRSLFGVMPSLWPEPFGSVVSEAMSRGKAVIGTRHGGHTDMIIEGETGFLVPPGDANALASAMAELIRDPACRERLGRAARERAELFTAHVAIPMLIRTYDAVIGKAANARSAR